MSTKKSYSVQEVAKLFGRSHQDITYWARKIGVRLKPRVTRQKYYHFTEEDIKVLEIRLTPKQ